MLAGHNAPVRRAIFSPDGAWVLTSSEDGLLRLGSATDGALRWTFDAGARGLGAPGIWSAAGREGFVSTRSDGAVLYSSFPDILAGERPHVLRGHDGDVHAAALGHRGDWFVTGGADGSILTWETPKSPSELVARSRPFLQMAVLDPDEERIAVAGDGFTLEIVALDASVAPVVLSGHESIVWTGEFSGDGRRFLTASSDGTARVWDAATGAMMSVLHGPGEEMRGASFDGEGKRVAVGGDQGFLEVWEPATNVRRALAGHDALVRKPRFSPDGRVLVTASDDRTARLWPLDGGEEGAILSGHRDIVTVATLDRTGGLVLTASLDGTARIWQAEAPFEQLAVVRHQKEIRDAGFDMSGELFYTTSDDGTVGVWTTEGERIRLYRGHGDRPRLAAFSPRWPWMISGAYNGELHLWRVNDDEPGLPFSGHDGLPWMLTFTRDGDRLFSAFDDGTVRSWDTRTRQRPLAERLKGCMRACPSASAIADKIGSTPDEAAEIVRACEAAHEGL